MAAPRPDAPPRTAWSIADAALSLGVSKSHVRRLITNGELRSFHSGGRVLVPLEELDPTNPDNYVARQLAKSA